MSASPGNWAAVILAAGLGKRMRSDQPKVLHSLAGRAMVRHVREAVRGAGIERCIAVVAHGATSVRTALGDDVEFAEQIEPLGTGHAVAQARAAALAAVHVLVLNGDVPLITSETLLHLMEQHERQDADLTFLTALVEDPGEYGRVHRDAANHVLDIVEAMDLEGSRNGPAEINAGQYCFRSSWLWAHLEAIVKAPNGEFYLTSLIATAVREGASVHGLMADDPSEVRGINDRSELAEAERLLRHRINKRHMLNGVTFVDPATTYVDAAVSIGRDTIIEPNTHLRGATILADRCYIGPDSDLRDAKVGKGCRIVSSSVEESVLEEDVEVGPYSHLRPGAYLCAGVHMGNFAEVKSARLGRNVKVGHFSYIGDADIGDGTNIGAGTITCNYDGDEKHHTSIGRHVFIGSDTMLIAPVSIGDGARTGAGSIVTKDVPPNALAVGSPARIVRDGATKRSSA